jgi:hypothetical protein
VVVAGGLVVWVLAGRGAPAALPGQLVGARTSAVRQQPARRAAISLPPAPRCPAGAGQDGARVGGGQPAGAGVPGDRHLRDQGQHPHWGQALTGADVQAGRRRGSLAGCEASAALPAKRRPGFSLAPGSADRSPSGGRRRPSPPLTASPCLGGLQVEDALAALLDDHLVMAQSMGFSPYKKPFEERIAKWSAQLALVRRAGWRAAGRCATLVIAQAAPRLVARLWGCCEQALTSQPPCLALRPARSARCWSSGWRCSGSGCTSSPYSPAPTSCSSCRWRASALPPWTGRGARRWRRPGGRPTCSRCALCAAWAWTGPAAPVLAPAPGV